MANDKNLKESFLAASPFLIKIFELVLALLSLGLIIFPYNEKLQTSAWRVGLDYSAFIGAILINILIIISHFSEERIPRKPCLIIGSFYGTFLLMTAILIIIDWSNIQNTVYPKGGPPREYRNMLIASGVFSLFTSFSFFADVGLTLKYG